MVCVMIAIFCFPNNAKQVPTNYGNFLNFSFADCFHIIF